MNDKTFIHEVVKGIAFPADRSALPRQCNFNPYTTESLLRQPASPVSYEDIDRAVEEGLVSIPKYGVNCSVVRTYMGQLLYLETQAWWNTKDWRARWAKYLCCAKAIVGPFCVCTVRTMCPDHGTLCNGSHD